MDKTKRTKVLKQIFSEISKDKINAIVLFGSRARGDHTKNSDYDINVYLTYRDKEAWHNHLSGLSYPFQVHIIDSKGFKDMKKEAHPFVYCVFRDGIPLYQKKEWFSKLKKEVLLMKPSKKTIQFYLTHSLNLLLTLRWHVLQNRKRKLPCDSLEIEDGKVIANKLGFGLLMQQGKYPLSPHTLTKELYKTSKKYKKVVNSILYLQNVYYERKQPQINSYIKHLNVLLTLLRRIVKQQFPEEYKRTQKLDRIYKRIV